MPCSKGIRLASSYSTRIKGLLGDTLCQNGEVLVLIPCRGIHTFFMRDQLDVAFIDKEGRVILSARGLKPWRTLSVRSSVCVLERRTRASTQPWFISGDQVSLTSLQLESLGVDKAVTTSNLSSVQTQSRKHECTLGKHYNNSSATINEQEPEDQGGQL